MNFENNLAFVQALDQADLLRGLRQGFLLPKKNGKTIICLCDNSLWFQPKATYQVLGEQLNIWQNFAVEGWFKSSFISKKVLKELKPNAYSSIRKRKIT